MAAHLYIASLYEKRRDEFKLEELRVAWQKLRSDGATAAAIHKAWKAYDNAGNEALKGCYWQDDYNQSCLFWLLWLDHWTEASHVVKGTMPVARIKVLRDRFAGADVREAVYLAVYNGLLNAGMPSGSPKRRRPELVLPTDESVDLAVARFEEKRDALVALFDQAIALDEGIRWST